MEKTKAEILKILGDKHSEWNAMVHPEDKMPFGEWMDDRIGDVLYGYKVIEDGDAGFDVVRISFTITGTNLII
jgi:hypothetical protein